MASVRVVSAEADSVSQPPAGEHSVAPLGLCKAWIKIVPWLVGGEHGPLMGCRARPGLPGA
jgi:hypothetical protein